MSHSLGELPGHAADLDDGHGASEGQDQRHLEQDTEGVPDLHSVRERQRTGDRAASGQDTSGRLRFPYWNWMHASAHDAAIVECTAWTCIFTTHICLNVSSVPCRRGTP